MWGYAPHVFILKANEKGIIHNCNCNLQHSKGANTG